MIVYEMDTGEENERDEVSENNSSIYEDNEVRNRVMMEGESHDPDSWINYFDYPGEDKYKMSDFCDVFCKKIQRLAKKNTRKQGLLLTNTLTIH